MPLQTLIKQEINLRIPQVSGTSNYCIACHGHLFLKHLKVDHDKYVQNTCCCLVYDIVIYGQNLKDRIVIQAVVAVSVETLVFIVIGCSCSKGCVFDSYYRPGSVLRFNSRPIMYSAVGSLVLRWSWTRQPGYISFQCLWIQLCNNLGQRLCVYNLP